MICISRPLQVPITADQSDSRGEGRAAYISTLVDCDILFQAHRNAFAAGSGGRSWHMFAGSTAQTPTRHTSTWSRELWPLPLAGQLWVALAERTRMVAPGSETWGRRVRGINPCLLGCPLAAPGETQRGVCSVLEWQTRELEGRTEVACVDEAGSRWLRRPC